MIVSKNLELLGLFGFLFVLAVSPITPVEAQSVTIALVSDNPADFSVAEMLKEKAGFEIIVTSWGSLNETAYRKILLIKPSKVIIIGGPIAIPESAERILSNINISVERYWGMDRFETASKVCQKFWPNATRIVVAQGFDIEGIQEAIKRAKAEKAPIIFAKPGAVPNATVIYISITSPNAIVVIQSPDFNRTIIVNKTVGLKITVRNITQIKVNLTERAESAIKRAEAKIAEVKRKILNTTGIDVRTCETLINISVKELENAKKAFGEGKYGEAFGRANAAYHIATNAERIVEWRTRVEEFREINAVRTILSVSMKIDAVERLTKGIEDLGGNVSEVKSLIESAKTKLKEAQKALEEGRENDAINLAREARRIADQAKRLLFSMFRAIWIPEP